MCVRGRVVCLCQEEQQSSQDGEKNAVADGKKSKKKRGSVKNADEKVEGGNERITGTVNRQML